MDAKKFCHICNRHGHTHHDHKGHTGIMSGKGITSNMHFFGGGLPKEW